MNGSLSGRTVDVPAPAPLLPIPPRLGADARIVSYEVVHWIDGRIRLRIPRLARDKKFARRLAEALHALPALKQARISESSASLVVAYEVGMRPAGGRSFGFPTDAAPGRVAANRALLPDIVACIRQAAGGADVQQLAGTSSHAGLVQPGTGALTRSGSTRPPVNYAERLSLPALGISLSACLMLGVPLPGVLVGGVILAAALPIFKRTVQGVREEKRLTVDFLDASAIVLLTAQSSFLAPAIVIGIIEGSEILRDWTARRQGSLQNPAPPLAHAVWVERGGRQLQVSLAEIAVGDEIVLFAGDPVPVDGCVLTGRGLIAQHQLTGTPDPLAAEPGDCVYVGTHVAEGCLRIVATQTGAATHVAQVLALAAAAPRADTRVSNYARKVGNPAVVPTLAVGAAVLATSGSIARATGIVSLDFGTGMRVSTPIVILRAQAHAEQHGILIRSGRSLEMLAQADMFVFGEAAFGPGAAVALADLCSLQRTPLLISAASRAAVHAVVAELKLAPEHVYTDVLPHQKAELVQALRARGHKVAVLGAGLNDVPAMAYADVSIALANAGEAAVAAADIVLLHADLRDLCAAIAIAQQSMRVIEQNKTLVVAPNAAAIVYGAVAVLNPIAGVIINNGVALVAALNSLRPLVPAQERRDHDYVNTYVQ